MIRTKSSLREYLPFIRRRRLLLEMALVGVIWAVALSPLGKWRL